MARGQIAEVGQTRVSKNGYHYTKTDTGWELTHHLTAEKVLGRPLREDEIVQFVDKKYKRDPTNPRGIKVIRKKTTALRRREAVIEARIAELQDELAFVRRELAETNGQAEE